MPSVLRGPAPPQVLLEEQHGDRTICAHKSPACFFISFNMNLPACPVPVTYEASRTTVVPRLIASRDSARQRDQFEKSSPVNTHSFDPSIDLRHVESWTLFIHHDIRTVNKRN